jgi:hypothetical protein
MELDVNTILHITPKSVDNNSGSTIKKSTIQGAGKVCLQRD